MSTVTIEKLTQALVMRKLRNACREFMTNDTREIGIAEQTRWFYDVYRPKRTRGMMRGYLFVVRKLPIGYGLIRREGGKTWISGGLRPDWRGKGYGHNLFTILTAFAASHYDGEVYLEVLSANDRARRIYEELGFAFVGEEDGVITMRR